jgi:predicted porin
VNPSSISTFINYTQGPLVLGYSWEKHKDQYRSGNVQAGGSSPAVAGGDERGQMLIAAVTFGPLKVGLETQKFKKNSGVANQRVTDQKSNMANVTYTAGKHQFAYQYAKSKDGDVSTAAVQPNSNSSAFGYFYNFTKRTTFVAHYITVKNNINSKSNFGANPLLTLTADADPKGLGIGFRHLF